MEDHIHILTDIHPSIASADFVKEIKTSSSNWIKETGYSHSLMVGVRAMQVSPVRSAIWTLSLNI
jgi:REP element-mobilizing transposase RayT